MTKTLLFFKSKWQAIYVNNAFQSPEQNYTISKNNKPTILIVSGVKTTSVMLKATKKTDPATTVHVATLQLLNFHISRKIVEALCYLHSTFKPSA